MSHYWISLSVECNKSQADVLAQEVGDLASKWAEKFGLIPANPEVREDWLSTSGEPHSSEGAELTNQEITSGPDAW
jgi:hypothetical protein